MKILIAEDDLNIRLGLCDLLEDEGYTCIEASNGADALVLFAQNNPDLVLLDIMMPELDGYAACRKIRQFDEQVPVIFITAKSQEIDQVLGLELGADDYIKKPFGTREVIARIRAVIRRCSPKESSPAQTANNQFELADIIVFPEQMRAERDEHKIELTLRDVKILELLHKEQGKVVTRDMLFDFCWGRNYLPSSRTLDQHISKLRKLIELDPKKPQIIKTVHGIGYRYDD